jgi:hypothetical protein
MACTKRSATMRPKRTRGPARHPHDFSRNCLPKEGANDRMTERAGERLLGIAQAVRSIGPQTKVVDFLELVLDQVV